MQDASQTDNDIFEAQLLAQLQSNPAVQLLPEVVKIKNEIWEYKHKTELLRQQNNVPSPKVIAARNELAALEAEHTAYPARVAQANQEHDELMEMNKQAYLAYATLKEQCETEEASKADEKDEGDARFLMELLYDALIIASDVIDGNVNYSKEENITILKEYLQLSSKPNILQFCASEDGLTELVQEQSVRAQLTLDKLEGFTQDERGDVTGNGVERAVADGNADLVEEEPEHGDTDGVAQDGNSGQSVTETDADSEVGSSQQDQDVTPAEAVLPDSQPVDTVMEIGTSSADEEDKAESMVCEPDSAMAETETETLPDIAGESDGDDDGTQAQEDMEPETEDVGPTEKSEVVEDEVMCGPEKEHKEAEERAETGERMELVDNLDMGPDDVHVPAREEKEDIGGELASTSRSTADPSTVEQVQPEPEAVDMPKQVDVALQAQEPANTSRSSAAASSIEQVQPESVDMPNHVDDAVQAQAAPAEQKSVTVADAPPALCSDVSQADGDISANSNVDANSTSVMNLVPASVDQNQKTVAPTNPAPSKEKAVIIVKQEPAEPVADDRDVAPGPPHMPQRRANSPVGNRRACPYLFPQAQTDAIGAYFLANNTMQERASRSYSEGRGFSVHGKLPFSLVCAPLRSVVVKKEEPDVATVDGVDQASTITPRTAAVQPQRRSRTRVRKLTSDRMIANSANSSAIIFDSPDVQCLGEIQGRVTRSALRNARSALAVATSSSSAESLSKKAPATKSTSTGRGRKTTQAAGIVMPVKKEEPEDETETPVRAGKKNTCRGRGRKARQGAGKAKATLVKKEDSADETDDEASVSTGKKEATSKRRSATTITPKNKGGSKSKTKGTKKQTPKQAQKAVKEEVDEDDDVALGTIAASTTSSGGRTRKRKPIFSPPPTPKAKRSVGRPRKSATGAVSATTTPAATAQTAKPDGKRSRSAASASASAKRLRATTVSAAQLAKNQASESPELDQTATRRRLRSTIPARKD